jgi:hypothetical protein
VIRLAPNPSRCNTISDPDLASAVRKLTCRHYNRCLTDAFRQAWEGFSCEACLVDDNLSPEEQRLDFEGLAGLLAQISPANGR